jgi:hypothetical protein
MQRIIKRFLLHRDSDNDDTNEMHFDELKQDLQMIRYEMNNDLKKSREENSRILNHVNTGLILLGEQLFISSRLNDDLEMKGLLEKFNQFKEFEIGINDHVDDENHTSQPSTSSMLLNDNSNLKPNNDNDAKRLSLSDLNIIKEED